MYTLIVLIAKGRAQCSKKARYLRKSLESFCVYAKIVQINLQNHSLYTA